MDRGFIYGLVDIFPGALKTPARWVADRIFGAWDDLGAVFRLLRGAWELLFGGIYAFARSHISFLWQAATTLRWIIVTRIVQVQDYIFDTLGRAINGVQSWADQTIHNGLSTLERWVTGLWNSVWERIDALTGWATRRIGELWDWAGVVGRRVADLLSDPAQMVDWILGPLITALLQWLESNVERLAASLWAQRQAILVRSLGTAESILERIL